MKRKILSLLLAVFLLVGLLPTAALAAEQEEALPEPEVFKDMFADIGISAIAADEDSYYAPDTPAPGKLVAYYLRMSGALDDYFGTEPGTMFRCSVPYETYAKLADAAFEKHEDMKAYMIKENAYDASTDTVIWSPSGGGDVWDWIPLSVHRTENGYQVQGLFLLDPVDDDSNAQIYRDYFPHSYVDEEGVSHTSNIYIYYPVELTVMDQAHGGKINGYTKFDYYIHKAKTDSGAQNETLYVRPASSKKTEDETYNSVTLMDTQSVTFLSTDGKPLADTMKTFVHNDHIWYPASQGFSFDVKVNEGYVLQQVECTTTAGTTILKPPYTVPANSESVTLTAVVKEDSHHYGDWSVTKAATCTEAGVEARSCTDTGCDAVQTRQIAALGHAWDEGILTKAATKESTGSKTLTCTRCNAVKTVTLPMLVVAAEKFADVAADTWSTPGIQYCVENGIMSGTGGNLFAPAVTTTRAQIVQILYNLEGEPAVSEEAPFTDLTQDWYKNAISWAYQKGVVAGVGDKSFAPDLPVTREQIAVIIMEYVDRVLKLEHSWKLADLRAFPDSADVSGWAKNAVADAVALGLISGEENNGSIYLNPQGSATREQVATILMEFCTSVRN